MSQVPPTQTFPQNLKLTEETAFKLLTSEAHIGTENLDATMERYVWKRRADGQFILNIQYTWDKIVLAARIIAAIENPKDVCVISARDWGQRAVLKFAHYTGATAISGRFTPGTFTNQQQQKDFKEPRLLIVTDTRVDKQPLIEASYVNIPTIAFANSDSPLQYVDVAIPCNNAAPHSIGLIYYLLCREVLRLRGTLPRDAEWEIMPDLFFWRDIEKEEAAKESEAENPFSADDAPKSSYFGGDNSTNADDQASDNAGGFPGIGGSSSTPAPWTGTDNDNESETKWEIPA